MGAIVHPTRSARVLAVAATLTLAAACAAGPIDDAAAANKREVIFAGNNWDGTVDVILPHKPFKHVAQLSTIPDHSERMLEMAADPERPLSLAYFLGIRQLVGEGNDQFVDDVYSSNDGRLLVASRPSFRDVVGIKIRTGEIVWRFEVDGYRSDHMAISPDGRHVAVSASTGNVVHILEVKTGEEVGRFESGDSPHENHYSEDGGLIFHASIGLVYTPADDPAVDTTKGDRWFQIVDTDSYEILERLDMGQELEEAGYPDMSSAVRPIALTPNEKKVFFQVSFFHGFVVYSFKTDRVTRVVELPNEVPNMPREQYLLDSAHHGIAMSGNGRKLCVAGTMSDYAAIVNRRSGRYKLFHEGLRPYWSTTSSNGRHCYVSWSGTDEISIISYRKRKEIGDVEVGNHPQRVRVGNVRTRWLRDQLD